MCGDSRYHRTMHSLDFKVFPGASEPILWKGDDVHSAEGERRPVFIAGVRGIAAVMKAAPQPPSSCPCWCLFNPAPLPEKMFACEPADVLIMDWASVLRGACGCPHGVWSPLRGKTENIYLSCRVSCATLWRLCSKNGKLSVKMLKIHPLRRSNMKVDNVSKSVWCISVRLR